MTRTGLCLKIAGLLALAGCSSDSGASGGASGGGGDLASGTGGTSGSTGGTTSTGGGTASGGTMTGTGGTQSGTGAATSTGGTTTGSGGTISTGGTVTGTGGAATSATYEEVQGWIDAYAAAHPGQAGDINAKTADQIAADPAAQQLLSLCGANQRPVIPKLAWEYGGSDHAWINPDASALVYCVYIPVNPSTDNWAYDPVADHVTADMYVLFPDQNPCKDEVGANQVMNCLGDASNIEILVDTASLNDGMDVGLDVSNASTEMRLILPDGSKVHMYDGL